MRSRICCQTPEGRYEVQVSGRRLAVLGTYADAAVGEIFALIGSFGAIEIAVREGNAAATLDLAAGAAVLLVRLA